MKDIIEQQKKHFEEISQTYYNARQNPNHLLYKELMWKYFFEKINHYFKNEKYDCIEPMCGYGEGFKILKMYSSIKFSYRGFDYSKEIVKIANENNLDLKIVQGNVLEYCDVNKYNLMILIGGLHHVYQNADKALKNLNTIMQKGGYFISFEPTHNNWFFETVRKRIYKKNALFDNESEQAFKFIELNSLFQNNGYTIVEQIYPGLIGYILYYNPDAFRHLNLGNNRIVRFIFSIEKLFFRNFFGKYFSFATLTLWKKNEK